MAKEILLYGSINQDSAAQFIAQLNDSIDEDIEVRVNTPGGQVAYGYGMIAKFAEHPKSKKVKVDGMAFSAGFQFCVNADYVECLDVSDFMMHRAAYPEWIESNPEYFDEAMKAELNKTNALFEKAIKNKLDVEAIQEIMDSKVELKGAKFKDIFSLDTRLDIYFTAKEAKKIKLVDKINVVTPKKKAEVLAYKHLMAAEFIGLSNQKKEEVQTQKQIIKMDLQTFKVSHPSVYAEAMAEGVSAEKDRVEGWLTFNEVDAKAVSDGIASGKGITAKNMGEFTLKAMGKSVVADAAAEAAPAVKLAEAGSTSSTTAIAEDKKKEVDFTAFRAEMDAKIKEKIGSSY